MANLSDLFKGEPLSVTIRRIQEGLKAPKDSGEYKYARFAMTRIVGPPSISFACSLLLLLMAIFMAESRSAVPDKTVEASLIEPETKKTDEIKPEEEKVKPPEEEVITDRPDLAPGPASPIQTPGPTSEYSSGDKSTDTAGVGGDLDVPMVPYAAVMTKSPVVIKGLYGNRTKGGREAAGRAYGGGGGAGFQMTEKSVLLALRWLKKYQEADGSWNHASGGGSGANHQGTPAFTALALLCFLAHGETPASEEFGYTVEKGIRWLVENQQADGRWKDKGGNGYCLPIGAYALCEAYGMTKVPTIQAAAEKSIETIIAGQHPGGGWDYDAKQDNRNDTSVMAWCAQALKAGYMAGLTNKDLKPAMKKAIEGFKANSGKGPDGSGYTGFGYDGPGNSPLTGAGTLCMQLLGGSKEKECRDGVLWLDHAVFDWDKWVPATERPIYHFYYMTQAKFHAGGNTWTSWNKQFSPVLVKNQVVLKGGGVDGKDIGYWDSPSKGEAGYSRTYSTTLCCLMLEVYYRYLPTFKGIVEEGAEAAPAAAAGAKDKPKEDKPNIVIE